MLNLFKMSCRYVRIPPETKYILVLYNPSAAVCAMSRCLSNQKVLWNGTCSSPWGLFVGFKRVNSKQFMECCASAGCFSKFYYVLHVGSYFDLDYKWVDLQKHCFLFKKTKSLSFYRPFSIENPSPYHFFSMILTTKELAGGNWRFLKSKLPWDYFFLRWIWPVSLIGTFFTESFLMISRPIHPQARRHPQAIACKSICECLLNEYSLQCDQKYVLEHSWDAWIRWDVCCSALRRVETCKASTL